MNESESYKGYEVSHWRPYGKKGNLTADAYLGSMRVHGDVPLKHGDRLAGRLDALVGQFQDVLIRLESYVPEPVPSERSPDAKLERGITS
jgi:hypothetical protein